MNTIRTSPPVCGKPRSGLSHSKTARPGTYSPAPILPWVPRTFTLFRALRQLPDSFRPFIQAANYIGADYTDTNKARANGHTRAASGAAQAATPLPYPFTQINHVAHVRSSCLINSRGAFRGDGTVVRHGRKP